MKITKTLWKTEIEITPDEVRGFIEKLPVDFLRGSFMNMMQRIFNKYF